MKIVNIDIKQDKNGKDYKALILENGIKVNIFSSHSKYQETIIGGEVTDNQLTQQGKFWNLKDEQEKPRNERFSKLGQIAENVKVAQDRKAEMIKDAQERTSVNIAYFNSVNSALEVLKMLNQTSAEQIKEYLPQWRDWFLTEWKNYEVKDLTEKIKPF